MEFAARGHEEQQALEALWREVAAAFRADLEQEALEELWMEVAAAVRADLDTDSEDIQREPSIRAMVPSIDCLLSLAKPSQAGPHSSAACSKTSVSAASNMTKENRLDANRFSTVDAEIIRGIPLRRSLKGLGHIWRYQPATWSAEQRAKLYDLSQKVQYFDVFVSHTWHTPGWHKTLALSFQCGWRSTLGLWCVAETASMLLCLVDVLPMPLVFQANVTGFTDDCPMGLWVWTFGALAICFGLLLTPYVPEVCSPSEVGFIDVASIHQQDRALMERGVYGIGGFLRVSSELRILWSGPYLSRLWCIFELAAYRKVNPDGIIRFRPLFVERTASVLLVSCLSFGFFVLGRSGSGSQVMLYIAYAWTFITNWIAVAVLRSNYREKHQLLRELQQFDLNKVSCRQEFDRQFIHAAISKWYGSKEDFTQFVRQELRRDLEPCLATRFPMRYLLLLCAAFSSTSLEYVLALWKGGAPTECILSFAVAVLLGVNVFVLAGICIAMNYLSDRFAAQRFGRLDQVQALLIVMPLAAAFGAANFLGHMAYVSTLTHCLLFAGACGVMAGCLYWLEKTAPMPDGALSEPP
ncbi:unnamed protein product [Symbiodinium microadriaticum]|nr:unnamed protein product [Symbiodinium microadriaticum]